MIHEKKNPVQSQCSCPLPIKTTTSTWLSNTFFMSHASSEAKTILSPLPNAN